MNYCRRCGANLTKFNDAGFKCTNGHTLFLNSAPTAGVFFITEKNEVILGVRALDPNKGTLDCIGGFIEPNETAEEALIREIQEEIGLSSDQYEELSFLSTETFDYPYAGEARPVLSIFFSAKLKSDAKLTANDDVAELRIIPISDVSLESVGNDDVRKALKLLQASHK